MKKILALVLASFMVISLAACGTKETAEATTEAATTAAATTSAAATAAETTAAAPTWQEEHPTWLCEDKTTLTLLTYDAVNSNYPAPSNDLEFWQWLEDYTNVHIEWDIASYQGYDEVIGTRLASGEALPDIVVVNSATKLNAAGQEGTFVDLSKYKDLMPNTQKFWNDLNKDYFSMVSNEDGSAYIFGGSTDNQMGHFVIMYNTDWMEELGAEVPTTLEDFEALLYKMKEHGDFNKNGEDDEVILSSVSVNGLDTILNNVFGMYAYNSTDKWNVKDGTVISDYISDNEKALRTWESKLYKDGILDPEICTMSNDIMQEKVAQDRVGVIIYYSTYCRTYGKLTTTGSQREDSYGYIPGEPLASEYNGNQAFYVYRDDPPTTPTGVNSKCGNIELAVRWLDTYTYDPVVYNTNRRGIEGRDWLIDENGDYIQPDTKIDDKAAAGFTQHSLPQVTIYQYYKNTDKMPWYTELQQKLMSPDYYTWKHWAVPRVSCYTAEETELKDEYETDCKDYFKEMRDKFIMGQADIEKEWDSYVQYMKGLGIDELTRAYQSVYDRTR